MQINESIHLKRWGNTLTIRRFPKEGVTFDTEINIPYPDGFHKLQFGDVIITFNGQG